MDRLEVRSLSKRFQGLHALNRISFDVQPGELLGIVGPNGAGKTTLLNCITGLLPLSNGSVRWRGREISRLRPFEIARMGIARTFQHNRLFRRLTVDLNLRIALEQAPNPADPKVGRLLEMVGLDVAPDSLVNDLPYGHQRLLTVACALALRPSLVLLDEPGAGLQQCEKARLTRLIERLVAENGVGVVIIDHDVKMIVRLCHRLLVLNHGDVIAAGKPEEVVTKPEVAEAYLGRGLSFLPSAD